MAASPAAWADTTIKVKAKSKVVTFWGKRRGPHRLPRVVSEVSAGRSAKNF
jgi:hypothetical protein